MDSLNQIHFLYQYSLKMFLDMFSSVLLSNSHLDAVSDYQARLQIITKDLFLVRFFAFIVSLHLNNVQFKNRTFFRNVEILKHTLNKQYLHTIYK